LGGPNGKNRIYKSIMQQSRHHYVALYPEEVYETLALETHFDVKCPDFPIENWPSFQCKLCKTCYKDKNTLSYHRMLVQCPKYKGKELLKMYLTWTKYEAKELTRLGEKHAKTLPNKSRYPNNDATKHLGKKVASTSLKSQDKTLPPPRPIHKKYKVVVELK